MDTPLTNVSDDTVAVSVAIPAFALQANMALARDVELLVTPSSLSLTLHDRAGSNAPPFSSRTIVECMFPDGAVVVDTAAKATFSRKTSTLVVTAPRALQS